MALRFLLALLVFNLSACASMQQVDLPADGQSPPGVRLYSEVELFTVDGETHEFVVTEINDQGLGGQPGFFNYQDIRELKVRMQQRDNSEIWAVLGGIVLLGLLAVGISAGAEAAGASSLLSGGD